jgi:hypothetical protein
MQSIARGWTPLPSLGAGVPFFRRATMYRFPFLGSGLIDQSQKMTAAAMQMAEKKVWAHRS